MPAIAKNYPRWDAANIICMQEHVWIYLFDNFPHGARVQLGHEAELVQVGRAFEPVGRGRPRTRFGQRRAVGCCQQDGDVPPYLPQYLLG